jgi:hypothetical protein
LGSAARAGAARLVPALVRNGLASTFQNALHRTRVYHLNLILERGSGLEPATSTLGISSKRPLPSAQVGDLSLRVEHRLQPISAPARPALPQNFADPAEGFCLKTDPTGGNDDEAVQQASRHDLARGLAPRYVHASRREKGQLLNEFCAVTGYTRKHALVLLNQPPVEQRASIHRGRPPSYGPAEVALLRMCWAATDGICSKRLAPFLPELLERLRRWHALRHISAETIQRVAYMSPSTIDRALAASRDGLPKRGLSTTRPGTLLKHQVAIKTFADWTETKPGFVEVDLVAHCGWTGAGRSCTH